MDIDSDRDFKTLAAMKVPVKRAAYSDRTAWTMAILAELAYTPFDEDLYPVRRGIESADPGSRGGTRDDRSFGRFGIKA